MHSASLRSAVCNLLEPWPRSIHKDPTTQSQCSKCLKATIAWSTDIGKTLSKLLKFSTVLQSFNQCHVKDAPQNRSQDVVSPLVCLLFRRSFFFRFNSTCDLTVGETGTPDTAVKLVYKDILALATSGSNPNSANFKWKLSANIDHEWQAGSRSCGFYWSFL